jgi:hypothetical protein
MDIVVTIPKSEYKNDDSETDLLLADKDYMQFWVMKKMPKNLDVGDRAYFVKHGEIESSMKIYDFEFNAENECLVTNRKWAGCTLYMTDLRDEKELNIKIKGFQGFRYKWW